MMASQSTVRMNVEGWDELIGRFKEMAGPSYLSDAREVLTDAAKPVEEEARRIVRKRSGAIADAIYTSKVRMRGKAGSDAGSAYIKVGVRKNAGAGGAIPLEWGHLNRDGTATPPYPFMQPAYESKKDEAYRIIRDGLKARIFKRGGGT